jgi:hypothetical protein
MGTQIMEDNNMKAQKIHTKKSGLLAQGKLKKTLDLGRVLGYKK